MDKGDQTLSKGKTRKFGCLQVTAIVFAAVIITAGATYWLARSYFFPAPFRPVKLSAEADRALENKIGLLTGAAGHRYQEASSKARTPEAKDRLEAPLEPQPYSEKGLNRLVRFSETELNALIAKNTDLATKVAIDLSDNLISARLRLPVDPDFPFLGGRIIRARAGLELAYQNGRPVVVLKGVSVMGVPVPNAWLGGLKNVDLVKEFGGRPGFWKKFSEGIEYMKVEDGQLVIKLKE